MSGRREARQFEPPPWEKEQFEEFAKRRGEEQKESELETALAELAARPPASSAASPRPAASVPPNEVGDVRPANEAAPSPAVDDTAVASMLAQLAAEEPSSESEYWKWGVAAAVLLGALGCVLIIWGMAGMLSARRSGQVGLAGGTGLLVIGGLFVGAGVWVVVSNLRKRGVI